MWLRSSNVLYELYDNNEVSKMKRWKNGQMQYASEDLYSAYQAAQYLITPTCNDQIVHLVNALHVIMNGYPNAESRWDFEKDFRYLFQLADQIDRYPECNFIWKSEHQKEFDQMRLWRQGWFIHDSEWFPGYEIFDVEGNSVTARYALECAQRWEELN